MIEQRKSQRFELKLPFEILAGATRTKVTGETRNLSSSGVLFSGAAPVRVGEPVEYLITFPRSASAHAEVRLRCVGKVVREEPEMGYAASLERYEFVREPLA
jgi:hypothetical protein